MTEIATNPEAESKRSLGQWLFNPFKFIAGLPTLLIGLAVIIMSSFIGSFSNTHFDGVIDVHTGIPAPLWFFLTEGVINWICLAVPLLFFGLIFSRSSFRTIDIFGTQALARWPHIITAIVMLPDANRRFGMYLMSTITQNATPAEINYLDILIFLCAAIISLLMIIWMVVLMYRSYAVSCNIKGPKAVITFIISLIGAEVLSKIVIISLMKL